MLSANHLAWFEGDRGIDPETASRYGVCTKRQGDGEVLVFPFEERGEVVNEKFRRLPKTFWQREGGASTFWNHDALLDDSLRLERPNRLIITEGEMDALTAIECGFPLTVSVPDGAPAAASDGPVDPDRDGKFAYIWRCWGDLQDIREIIVAADSDGPGKVLSAELVRRLGVDRCWFIEYPPGCKDLNDVLVKHGKAEVARVLNAARPYPVRGLYRLSELPDLPEPETFSTGWLSLDPHFRVEPGAFVVITGVPGHGKSTFASALVANLTLEHGWTVGFAGFEMPPVPYHRDQLRAYFNQKRVPYQSAGEKAAADAWIERQWLFIAQNVRDDDQEFDLDQILELAAVAVVRHGIRALVLDPWNEIEHKRRQDEAETDYINRAIRALKRFARRYGVCVIVVAHPVKMTGGQGAVHRPTLYDVAGSAAWFNKCDVGIVVWRDDLSNSEVEIAIKKVRFAHTGRPGTVKMVLDDQSWRLSGRGHDEPHGAAA